MLKFEDYIYIYIIYTPNLGFEIAVFDQEREQGRLRGSSERARGLSERVRGSTEGARGSTEGALRRSKRERFWLLREPNLAALYSATAAPVIYPAVLSSSACCCLDSCSFAGS